MTKATELKKTYNYLDELMKMIQPKPVEVLIPVREHTSTADYGYSGNKPLDKF